MASMEPSEDDISQVVDFAGLNPIDDRAMIINALKNNNRNVETVVMQYFDNSESVCAFCHNPSRLGVTPPPSYAAGAPSRPPSRSNNRSPLGRMVEWTAGDTAGGNNIHSQEDEDMQRALRESAQEAGLSLPPQEAGVIDQSTSTPYFGPANRSDYDQDNWAMVIAGQNRSQLNNAPSPSQRKRDPESPAFLIQGSSSEGFHSLGGLLTILHEIPLARNIFLQYGSPANSYGFNSEWWNGQEILPPEALRQVYTDGTAEGDDFVAKPNFEDELHRLMAFLDSTERSYATVSTLAELIPDPSSGMEKQFYARLGDTSDALQPLYQEAILLDVDDDVVHQEAKFGVLGFDHSRGEYAHIKTLYEAFDHMMWSDILSWHDADEKAKIATVRKMGEVLVIKVGNHGPQDSFDIPTHLYPERYLASRKEEARKIATAILETKNAIDSVTTEERRLQEWQDDWNQLSFNKQEMIREVQDQWKAFSDYLETAGRFQGMEAAGFDTSKYPNYRDAPCEMTEEQAKLSGQVSDVLLLTQRIMSDMEARTQDLRAQLEQLQAKQRFLGRLLTDPDKQGRPKPMTCKKYQLRGVATERDVIYVCQRLEPESTEAEDAKPAVDQWWRLEYCPHEDVPVRSEKVEVERVLRDVWHETKIPVLVYATEEAVSTPKAPLSDALNMFVRSDNKAFRQELKKPATDSRDERRHPDPISPSKRKHRDSMDSMDTNRASIGSEDRNPFEPVFGDQMDQELAELSGETPEYVGPGTEVPSEGHGIPPPLPNRDQAQMAVESATLTPDTLAADEGEVQNPTSPKDRQADDAATKAPEMQERIRPPSIIRPPPPGSEGGRELSMDMEIPDVQE
ncbi:hypothetical protein BBK36DRAFT_1165829 [Trichoderma citrinoviride]|uniref:Ubiquitin interaction domain-containing protein n=1 Tax=Trichoderma citrinoviride TaxID=58853 RepID=A0A2T4BJU0_9HYPO|nr:hypothetical protein BBK36DRAFT_1165829 [Trichoderma citrinoviride]PTB69575.1 hypothetical protein BBK36DRAFT_1165829 [Trichoderma citrinoviride]